MIADFPRLLPRAMQQTERAKITAGRSTNTQASNLKQIQSANA
jgi:hypothetical protein